MNVPPACDSRASKRAMSSSRDSYLRLAGRVVPFSRAYPLTPKIIVGLVHGGSKMFPPHLSVIFALLIGNGPVQVRGKCRGAEVRERNGKSCKKPQSDETTSQALPLEETEQSCFANIIMKPMRCKMTTETRLVDRSKEGYGRWAVGY